MVRRPKLMVALFFAIIVVAGWDFARQPTGFLPTEDQGYAILVTRLPDAAAQPRARAVAEKISAILRQTPGVAHWVTVGGFSVLDGTNVSTIFTTFIPYQDFKQRGAALSQENNRRPSQARIGQHKGGADFVLIPPPIRGLGQAGGFQMMVEDRSDLGLDQLQKAASELVRTGNAQSGLRGLATTFSASSPQLYLDIDRTKAESCKCARSCVRDPPWLPGLFLRQSVQQVQPGVPGVHPADARYRLEPKDINNLYVRNTRGEMVSLGACFG